MLTAYPRDETLWRVLFSLYNFVTKRRRSGKGRENGRQRLKMVNYNRLLRKKVVDFEPSSRKIKTGINRCRCRCRPRLPSVPECLMLGPCQGSSGQQCTCKGAVTRYCQTCQRTLVGFRLLTTRTRRKQQDLLTQNNVRSLRTVPQQKPLPNMWILPVIGILGSILGFCFLTLAIGK